MEWAGSLGPLDVILPVFALILLALVIYAIYFVLKLSMSDREDEQNIDVEELDEADLHELVGEDLKDVVRKEGREHGGRLEKGLYPIGTIHKLVDFSETSEMSDVSFSVSKSDLEPLVERGYITKEQQSKYADNNEFPHTLIWAAPRGLLSSIVWTLRQSVIGSDKGSRYYLVPNDAMEGGDHSHAIRLHDKLQFREMGGVEVAKTIDSVAAFEGVNWFNLYKQMLSNHGKFAEDMIKFNTVHLQKIAQLKEKGKLDDYKNLDKLLSDLDAG